MPEVRKRRASGAPGVSFSGTQVARDDVGSWLLVDAGTPHIHDDGWVVFLSPNPVLLLAPSAGPWVASTSHTGAKVDLCITVTVDDGGLEFVDAELDVVWRWGEPACIEDLDEFHALELTEDDQARHLAVAERIRVSVDRGEAPLGPAFRHRIVELAGPTLPELRSTWAGGVGPILAAPVAAMVGSDWLARQQDRAGWLLCGGGRGVSAVIWIDDGQGARLLAVDGTVEGEAMASFLLDTAPSLVGKPPPPLPT